MLFYFKTELLKETEKNFGTFLSIDIFRHPRCPRRKMVKFSKFLRFSLLKLKLEKLEFEILCAFYRYL